MSDTRASETDEDIKNALRVALAERDDALAQAHAAADTQWALLDEADEHIVATEKSLKDAHAKLDTLSAEKSALEEGEWKSERTRMCVVHHLHMIVHSITLRRIPLTLHCAYPLLPTESFVRRSLAFLAHYQHHHPPSSPTTPTTPTPPSPTLRRQR
jgi:hypothetical protein